VNLSGRPKWDLRNDPPESVEFACSPGIFFFEMGAGQALKWFSEVHRICRHGCNDTKEIRVAMGEMKPRERVHCILAGEIPDRVSYFEVSIDYP
jgi:hypothetical protein